jgi:hypothetical protein
LKLYTISGFDALVEVKSGGDNNRTLLDKLIELIAQKVTDSKTTVKPIFILNTLMGFN